MKYRKTRSGMGWYLRLYIAVYAANNDNNNLALKFCTTTVIHNGSKGSWDLEGANWQDFSSSKYDFVDV